MFFLQFTNTFQSVVATNGTTTYAIFLYNNITANESAPAKVGFNDGMYFNMGSLSISDQHCPTILSQHIGVISHLQRLACIYIHLLTLQCAAFM